MHTEEELRTKIIDLDDTAMQYKRGSQTRLLKAWHETLKVTKPHLFDNNLSQSAVVSGHSPDVRNAGFKVGQKIVRDQVI